MQLLHLASREMTQPKAREPRTASNDSLLRGRATPAATRGFSDRFANRFTPGFYREAAGLSVSSIGMGTYLGECDDNEDARYVSVLSEGITQGLNLLDTAINYRCQRSERAVGEALRKTIASGVASRDEIVVCTKAGYVPLESAPPESRQQYDAYLKRNISSGGRWRGRIWLREATVSPPASLQTRSSASAKPRRRMIDVFYIHNPSSSSTRVTSWVSHDHGRCIRDARVGC